MSKIAVDKPVPNFSFNATSDIEKQLADFKGKVVVLYFYPKDNTPGCTTEACDFNTELSAFNTLDAVIFGISRDSLASHEKFKAKHHLQFELISDSDGELCDIFQVISDKLFYGKLLKGIQRSTFVIDQEGILRYEWRGVKVTNHIAEVLDSVQHLKASSAVALPPKDNFLA